MDNTPRISFVNSVILIVLWFNPLRRSSISITFLIDKKLDLGILIPVVKNRFKRTRQHHKFIYTKQQG
jgi:hypothetical protein